MRLIAFVSAAIFLASAPLSFAATTSPCTTPLPISVGLSSEIASTVASATINVHAAMHNGSAKPISGASLYVEVTNTKTREVVSRFITLEKLTFLPNSDAQSNFDWSIPASIPDGQYVVRAFVINGSTTYADLLLHTALMPHSDITVAVSGGMSKAVIASVSVNGADYTQGSGPVTISKSGATVIADVRNDTDVPYIGKFTWSLFAPNAKPGDEAISSKDVAVELHPHTSTKVSYTLSDTSLGGYFLAGELTDGGSTSYIETWLDQAHIFYNPKCTPTKRFPISTNLIWTVVALAVVALLLGAGRLLTRRKLI